VRIRRFSLAVFVLMAASVWNAAAQQIPNEYFNGLKWRLIGPFRGGRAVAAAGVPGDPNTFYFGSVGGGVWKTTNAGLTWTPIFDNEPIASIGAIAVAPSDPKVIYVGTGESDIRSALSSGDGVYKSTDGGATWKNIGLRDTRQISKIVVDPRNADVVYVGALGHAYGPNDERGVFKSTDGGATWKRVLDKGPEIGNSDLALAPGNPQILFAGMWRTKRPVWSAYAPLGGPGSGLYRSVDGGSTWTEIKGNGLPAGEWGRVGVDVASDGKRVYALLEVKPGAGLYRSDDGGDTWTQVNSDKRLTSRSWYFNWVTIDPTNADVVYVPNVALYRSEDGGKTVTVVKGEPGGDDYHFLWIDPKNPSRLVLASDQGTNISVDRGVSWSSWYNQATAQFYRIATDNHFPYWVMGSQQDSGSIAVASRSDHGVLSAQDMPNIGGGESGTLAPDPNDENVIYATGAYGSVSRYDRRTSFSQDVSPWPMPTWNTEINERKYRAPWTPPLLFSPLDKKALYLGTQFVMKTVDGGLHWVQISPDLTGSVASTAPSQTPTVENAKAAGFGVVYTIAPSPLNANVIWAGSDTGLIHVTADGGKTWKNVTPPGLSDWSKISTIEASRYEPGEAFAAVDRHRLDDQRPYVYRTRDFGNTWQEITNGIGGSAFLRVVREDVRKKGLLFAGTELGVYVSFDDGDHWQSLQRNLPVSSVQDMTIHGDDLVIGTHGRSLWILDDITALRQMSARSDPVLYTPADAYRVDNDVFLGTPLPPEEPQAANPPDGAIIDYFLKSTAREMKLEIYDGNHLLRRFTNADEPPKHMVLPIAERWFPEPIRLEGTSGAHRFVWDLRTNSSGASDAEDSSDEIPAPKGPRVVPGSYQVKLTVDGQAFTQQMKVKEDPRSHATAQQLAEQYRWSQEIYTKTMASRKAVSEIKSLQKQIEELHPPATTNPELMKRIASFQSGIKAVLDGDKIKKVMGLESANGAILAVLKVVESGDRGVPAQALELYQQAQQALTSRQAEWQKLKQQDLVQLNQELEKAGVAPLQMAEIEQEIDYLMTR
jgi:photosystem II stability/assembly factor-like uncharacterized protein